MIWYECMDAVWHQPWGLNRGAPFFTALALVRMGKGQSLEKAKSGARSHLWGGNSRMDSSVYKTHMLNNFKFPQGNVLVCAKLKV